MKAIIRTKYGSPDVLQLKDVEIPVPADDEVLVEVYAASVNAYDWHFLTADVFLIRLMGGGLFTPKKTILGADIAGRITAVGKNVKQFHPGDAVFGAAKNGSGGYAEFVCAPENKLISKPANVSFEDAACIPIAALTALQGLRDKGKIQSGQKVLIHGASGGVGTFAIQIAKSFGAEVTAVCSTKNVEIARSIGADNVIDYTKENFTESDLRYDLVFVANGNCSIFDYARVLKAKGICVIAGGSGISMTEILGDLLRQLWISKTEGNKIGTFIANINREDLLFMKEPLETGKVKPVIDRRFPLSEAAEALRYLGEGHAQGKVVVNIKQNNGT